MSEEKWYRHAAARSDTRGQWAPQPLAATGPSRPQNGRGIGATGPGRGSDVAAPLRNGCDAGSDRHAIEPYHTDGRGRASTAVRPGSAAPRHHAGDHAPQGVDFRGAVDRVVPARTANVDRGPHGDRQRHQPCWWRVRRAEIRLALWALGVALGASACVAVVTADHPHTISVLTRIAR